MVVTEATAGMILERLELGQRVAVLVADRLAARVAQQDILGWMEEPTLDTARIRRSSGAELVELPSGGRLTFHLIRTTHSTRGLSLDALYFPQGLADQIAWEDLTPCLAVTGGVTIGYWV